MGNEYEENWIATLYVKKFHFLEPQDDEIDIRDIAHALSLTCRYGGHTPKYYSVAEHCARGTKYFRGKGALAFLLHDAEEAYIPDIPRPVKKNCPELSWIGDNIRKRVYERFNISMSNWRKIKEIDDRMLITEAKIFGFDTSEWRLNNTEPFHDVLEKVAIDVDHFGWNPELAEEIFLDIFERNGGMNG